MKAIIKKDIHLKLAQKLVLLTSLVLACAILIVAGISIYFGSQGLRDQADKDTLEYTELAAVQITTIIDKNLAMLKEAAEIPGVNTMDYPSQQRALDALIDELGYQDIAVMDLAGNAKYLRDGLTFKDEGDRFWYTDGFAGKTVISDVAISRATNKPVIFEVTPIHRDGAIVGLLVGRRDPNFLADTVKKLGDGVEKYGFIYNAEGIMMAHPEDEKVLNQVNIFDEELDDGAYVTLANALKS